MGQQEEILYILIQDLKGEVLWKAIRSGMELEQNQFSKILISPRNSRAPKVEVTSLGNPSVVYIDMIEPVLLNEHVAANNDDKIIVQTLCGFAGSLPH